MHGRSAAKSTSVRTVRPRNQAMKKATKTKQAPEREYEFTLVLAGVTELTPDVVDALYESGCDDATLCMRLGRMYMTFARSAATLKSAILSAIRNVRQAKVGAEVLRVDERNLISQADIARKIGRPRQVVHQYVTGQRGPGRFPPPACHVGDDSPLWNWSDVAHWLWQNDMIAESTLREAVQVSLINTVLELRSHRRLDPKLADEVVRAVGA